MCEDLNHDLSRLIRYNSEMLSAIAIHKYSRAILRKKIVHAEWRYILTNKEFAAMLRCVGRCRRTTNELLFVAQRHSRRGVHSLSNQ